MLLTHINIEYLELVCISSVAILLQFPFQFNQKCKDSNAMAITSVSVTRPMADECSEDYFNQDFFNLITKTGLKRALIFFLINTISIDYGMQFEKIDFTSWQKRKFWKNIWHFELLRYVCSLFDIKIRFLSTANCGRHCKWCDRPGKCSQCVSGYTPKHGKCKRKSSILHGCLF